MTQLSDEDNVKTETPFTPGPWVALDEEEGSNYARVRGTCLGERFKIANVLFAVPSDFEISEARANARLIASAPDLHDALVQCRSVLRTALRDATEDVARRVLSRKIEVANAALAKAKGDIPTLQP